MIRITKSIHQIKSTLIKIYNPYYAKEKQNNHKSFGNITFLRGTFNDIPLPENHVDCLVSISAFEHNTYEDMDSSVQEFSRILKKNAPMLITTSATNKKKTGFRTF